MKTRGPDKTGRSYSTAMLGTEINVSRRTIERAIEAGVLVPWKRTESGRVRFSREQVEEIKCRVNAARSRGSKYVMGSITSTGTIEPPTERGALALIREKAWKRRLDMRRSYQVAMKFLNSQLDN